MTDLVTILEQLDQKDALHLLDCGRRGIEKEGLRYTVENQLSTSPHSKTLGSTLTHSEITTDYAESLLEIVTPAFRNSRETLSHLCYLHRVLAQDNDEYMLNASMPAYIADTEAVEVGYYGESNAGRMRRLYRQGLALRYGKAMQLIAGIHFNYSICTDLFRHYANILGEKFDQEFINHRYMNLVRNIRIHSWIIPYLFGHSPAVDQSFFHGLPHKLQQLDNDTLYLPYATSLRMSDIGYQNKTSHLVSANTLADYIAGLKRAVQTPSERYKNYGLKDSSGDYQQINTNILQIENEYYTVARPKQIGVSGEAPLKSLAERGIAYVELRTLDVNCFERCGISQTQLDFLELYMLYCLFTDARELDEAGESEAKDNMADVSCCGRDPTLKLRNNGQETTIPVWGLEILEAMMPIAKAMDSEKQRPHYVSILESKKAIMCDPTLTPSAKIMGELRGEVSGKAQSYHQFIIQLSQKHIAETRARGFSEAEKAKVKRDAELSLKMEKVLVEKSQGVTFPQYLDDYFKQLI